MRPGKTEMARDRAPLESALASLEQTRLAIKKFHKADRVQSTPAMKKASKAFRNRLRKTCEEAEALLQIWTLLVEDGGRKNGFSS